MRKTSITIVMMLLLAAILSACDTGASPTATPVASEPTATTASSGGTEATATTGSTGSTSSSGKTYVLVPKNLGNPYFDTANKGAQDAAKELGATVTYQGPSTADATQQIQLINSLVAQHVSGLAVSADDSDALVTAGKAAMAANIPVVSWDSAIATGGRNVHVNQANAEDIGRTEVQL